MKDKKTVRDVLNYCNANTCGIDTARSALGVTRAWWMTIRDLASAEEKGEIRLVTSRSRSAATSKQRKPEKKRPPRNEEENFVCPCGCGTKNKYCPEEYDRELRAEAGLPPAMYVDRLI